MHGWAGGEVSECRVLTHNGSKAIAFLVILLENLLFFSLDNQEKHTAVVATTGVVNGKFVEVIESADLKII